MRETTAVVVVTYNRKDLLIECLEALRNQIHQPDAIYIIDNLSTDGTPELLLEKKYIPLLPNCDLKENQLIQNQIQSFVEPDASIKINYIRKFENDGGAGGFFLGMKQAYEDDYDWIWCMDDDVYPKKDCLKYLFNCKDDFKVIAPLRIDIHNEIDEYASIKYDLKNPFVLSPKRSIVKNIYSLNNIPKIIEIGDFSFEGILFNKWIIEKVGLPMRELFYFGDDTEYALRIKKKLSLKLFMYTDAVIVRQQIQQEKELARWKLYFIFRNSSYIYKIYGENIFVKIKPYFTIVAIVLINLVFFNFSKIKLYLKAFVNFISFYSKN